MSIKQDIQTIAKTKELEDKIDKLGSTGNDVAKEAIDAVRSTILQSTGVGGTGSATVGSTSSEGTNASGTTVGVDVTAAAQQAAVGVTSATTSASDVFKNSLNGILYKNNLTGTNDLSGAGSISPIGGSQATLQATGGYDKNGNIDAIVASILAAMGNRGATQAEKDKAVRKETQVQEGTHDVGEQHDGSGGVQPITSNITPSNSNTPGTPSYLGVSSSEQIRALVGTDVDNPTLGVMVRFDGLYPVPTAGDAVAAGQGTWADANTPPGGVSDTTWQLGYYWYNSGNIISAIASTKFNSPEQAAIAITGLAQFNETVASCSGAPPFTTKQVSVVLDSVTYFNSGNSADLEMTVNTYYCPTNISSSYKIHPGFSKVSCAGATDGSCALSTRPYLTNPASAWPVTGVYSLAFQAGKFIGNSFDSEVPLKYKGTGSSIVQLRSAYDGLVYEITPAIGGGWMLYAAVGTTKALYFGADNTLRAVLPAVAIPHYRARDGFPSFFN